MKLFDWSLLDMAFFFQIRPRLKVLSQKLRQWLKSMKLSPSASRKVHQFNRSVSKSSKISKGVKRHSAWSEQANPSYPHIHYLNEMKEKIKFVIRLMFCKSAIYIYTIISSAHDTIFFLLYNMFFFWGHKSRV